MALEQDVDHDERRRGPGGPGPGKEAASNSWSNPLRPLRLSLPSETAECSPHRSDTSDDFSGITTRLSSATYYQIMTVTTLLVLIASCFVGGLAQSANGFYTITASNVLRPNSDYHVAVSVQGTSQPTQVSVEVGGKQDSGGTFTASQNVAVSPYTTQIVKLEIGDLGPGMYNLTARGSGGLEFKNSTELRYVHKSYSVFIQTDKAIYKPGHKVLFRAIVLNAHMKPTPTGSLDVYITDGKGHRVKQWNRALTTKGVFSGELQLSEYPVLGDWNIVVNALDQVFSKTFQVAEYVLPKFEVLIDAPKHATFKDSKVVSKIKAKYTYGKSVKGEATVTAYPLYYSGFIQPIFETPIRKVIPIDGKALVEFDIVKELKITDDYERTIQVDVTVEEALTGRRQNTSAQIILHKYKYKMELIKTAECFKPGLKYTAFIKLAYHDGKPVIDDVNPITVKHGFSYDTEKYTAKQYKLPLNGLLELNFYINDPNVTTLGIEASYLDLTEWFSTTSASMSPSHTYLQAILRTENPRINQDITVDVNSTVPLKYYNYLILGRGDVIASNTVQVQGLATTHKFLFVATPAMAPTAHVLVYFITEEGEVVADALNVDFDNILQNFVQIDARPSTTEPGKSVELSIQAKPNSYVGVLGIDQSVLLLKDGNDITHDDVLNELHSYDSGDHSPYSSYKSSFFRRFKRSFFYWPGSSTAKKVFDNSGTVILTNGWVYDYEPFLYYRSNLDGYILPELTGRGEESEILEKTSASQSPRIRQKFPETWLWDSIQSGLLQSYASGARGICALCCWCGFCITQDRSNARFTDTSTFSRNLALGVDRLRVAEFLNRLSGEASKEEKKLIAENRPTNRPILPPGSDVVKPDLGPAVTYRSRLRPPLAGPYAFSRIPVPVWDNPRVFLMHDVASTWLFTNTTSGYDGRATLKPTVPDTITSWVITAFSVDPVYGLGLIEAPTKVKVFRPFFVSLDLPYSIIRGEVVSIPVVVFNYFNEEVTAEVTLKNEGEFEFADVSNDVIAGSSTQRSKTVRIKANSGAPLSFMITPKTLGYISIMVTATSRLAGDGVDRKLLVKPEGETQYRNKAVFVDLRNKNEFKTNITLEFPNNIVPDSEYVEISAVGDILGPSIPNLQNLIKMPFGCGEQNMLNFVPNIVIMNYLQNTRQLTPAIQNRAMRFLEIGYQQELTYRRPDGSFSAFGKSDPNGSTWLTAFVAKSFKQAGDYITIEDRIIQEALHWLQNNQMSSGSFPEVGHVSHRDMQGGAAKGLALTAFTLLTFLETQKTNPQFKNTIDKAVDYIVKNLEGLEDPYAIAICCYALHLANHPSKDQAFHLLEGKARGDSEMKFWMKPIPPGDEKNPWHERLPNGISVEMTAYALLTYLERDLVEDALPIMKWLVAQRNKEGGFASTQDTVVGIFALAKLAEKISTPNVNIQTVFSYKAGSKAQTTINVDQQKSMILQKHELPRKVREVNITATGSGFAIVQVSYRFNLNVTGAWPLFTLDPQVDKNSDNNHLQVSICSGFVGTKETNESNMAVMEVSLPSGFVVDSDSLPSLRISQNVKRVETKEGDTVVVLYFDKLIKEEYCPTISAYRTHMVAKQKPVPVIVYDYYDSSRRARAFYQPLKATVCDICDEEECKKACSSERNSVSGNQRASPTISDDIVKPRGQSAASSFSASYSALLALCYVLFLRV